ncbi:MAG: energy-coupling factor transporter ATPase [Bacillota bacterium]
MSGKMAPVKGESGYICFRNASYSYPGSSGRAYAMQGINITVRRGGFTAVMGANGSGKTTLARHINGLLLPTSGEIIFDGLNTRDPANIFEIRRRVGFVFQNPDNQLVGATVEEDLAFGPENAGLDPSVIRESVAFAMRAAGIEHLAKRPPQALSGGQKQLVAIAGALAMKAECLVLDEPTAMIGPEGKRLVTGLLKEISSGLGITVILITHFPEEAVLADRVLVMDGGRIVMDGPPSEVFKSGSLLEETGLELPGPEELARRLRRRGVALPDPVLTVDELVDGLCRL